MKITKIVKHTEDELVKRLKNVSLLRNKDVFPYKNATIHLQNLSIDAIFPMQFYSLKDKFNQIEDLKIALKENGVDIFVLNGYVDYELETADKYTLLPPIVESSTDQKGKKVFILNDGIHRVLYARDKGQKSLQVVIIENVDEKFPIMGYPNPNGWSDVVPVSHAPEPKDKRIWRVPVEEGYLLYRNFNSAFESVGQPRKKGSQQ